MYGAANLRMEAGLRWQQSCSQIQLRARQRAIASVKSPVVVEIRHLNCSSPVIESVLRGLTPVGHLQERLLFP